MQARQARQAEPSPSADGTIVRCRASSSIVSLRCVSAASRVAGTVAETAPHHAPVSRPTTCSCLRQTGIAFRIGACVAPSPAVREAAALRGRYLFGAQPPLPHPRGRHRKSDRQGGGEAPRRRSSSRAWWRPECSPRGRSRGGTDGERKTSAVCPVATAVSLVSLPAYRAPTHAPLSWRTRACPR